MLSITSCVDLCKEECAVVGLSLKKEKFPARSGREYDGSMAAKKDFGQHALSIVEQITGNGPLIDTPEKQQAQIRTNSSHTSRNSRLTMRLLWSVCAPNK